MKLTKGANVDVYSTHCTGAHVGEVVESLRDAVGDAPARVSLMLRVERRDGGSCGLDDTLNQSKDGHLLRDVPVLVSPSQDDIEALLAREPFVGVMKTVLSAPALRKPESPRKEEPSVTSGDGGMRK